MYVERVRKRGSKAGKGCEERVGATLVVVVVGKQEKAQERLTGREEGGREVEEDRGRPGDTR